MPPPLAKAIGLPRLAYVYRVPYKNASAPSVRADFTPHMKSCFMVPTHPNGAVEVYQSIPQTAVEVPPPPWPLGQEIYGGFEGKGKKKKATRPARTACRVPRSRGLGPRPGRRGRTRRETSSCDLGPRESVSAAMSYAARSMRDR